MRNLSLFNIPKRAIKTKLPKRRIPISKEELELKKELMKTKQKVFGGVYAQKFNVPRDKINVFQLDQNEEYHSLLNNLYFFKYNEYNIGYILHESKTKSLLLFDNGNYDVSKDAVSRVQEIIGEQVQPELIFTTHHHADVSRGNTDWKRNLPNIEIFSGISC